MLVRFRNSDINMRAQVLVPLIMGKVKLFNLLTVKDIENDLDAQAQDCYIAVEALCEVVLWYFSIF